MINKLFVKFVLVGIINTIFGYSVFAFLFFLMKNYIAAVVISTLFGILFNFKTIGVLVFNNNDKSLIFKFLSVYVLTCLLSLSVLRVAAQMHFNLYFAGFITTVIMALLSFILNKNWVFGVKNEEN